MFLTRRLAGMVACGLLVLLTVTPARAAPACTGTVEQISFANWAAAETATAKEVGAAIAAFEQQNPCIEIKTIAIPFAEMVSQLTVMTLGDNTPDVMELSSGMPQALAAQGALADLRHDAASMIDDIQPGIREDGEYQGKLVALPLSLTPHGFWYDKGLMQQAGLDASRPPQTVAELDSDMQAIKAKLPKAYPFAMMTAKGAYAVVNMWPWLEVVLQDTANGTRPPWLDAAVRRAGVRLVPDDGQKGLDAGWQQHEGQPPTVCHQSGGVHHRRAVHARDRRVDQSGLCREPGVR